MKNKGLCVLLTLSMISAMSLPIFAGTSNTTLTTTNTSGDVTAYVDFGETYTISIPSEINLASSSEFTVTVDPMLIEQGHELDVKMTSTNYDSTKNNWRMKLGDSYMKYSIQEKVESIEYKSGDNILEIDAGQIKGSITLKTSYTESDAIYAGRYQDTLTFTVSVVDAN